MVDVFEKMIKDGGPIGRHVERAHGYFAFPKLEGELGSRMFFREGSHADVEITYFLYTGH